MMDETTDLIGELSDYSDDTNEEATAEPVVCDKEAKQPKPEYSPNELNDLVGFVKKIVFIYGSREADWNDNCEEVIKQWLTDTSHLMLTVYIDLNRQLTADLTYPEIPVFELIYFMREPNHIFNADSFHDDVTFGQLTDDVDGTFILLMEKIYAPYFFQKKDWSVTNRTEFLSALHTFLVRMTALHHKLSGLTVLYVPSEGIASDIEQLSMDVEYVKRLEMIAEYWIDQLRVCLSDAQQVVPHELMCPIDEYEFWVYRCETLLTLQHQMKHKDFQRILSIFDKSQSVFTKPLSDLLNAIGNEITRAQSNVHYLKLLIAPCSEISTAQSPTDIPLKMGKIINIIRYIWLHSNWYNANELIAKLYRYVGNQIVKFCCNKIDVFGIFTDGVQQQIKQADLAIDCCLYYKAIYDKLSAAHNDWTLDKALIFNLIDAFVQRLYDFIEICQGVIVFGRQTPDTNDENNSAELDFDGDRKDEFQMTCKHIENTFENGLKRIKKVAKTILDIQNKHWSNHMVEYRRMTAMLDGLLDNMIMNVFTGIENVDEGIYALACLHRFSTRQSLQKAYQLKVDFVWQQFADELAMTNDDLVDGYDNRLSCLPKTAGRAVHLKINLDRLIRLRALLNDGNWLSNSISTPKILSDYNEMIVKLRKTIKKLFEEWQQTHGVEIVTKLNRLLLKRSLAHTGLFECNVDHELFTVFAEIRYFKLLGFGLPVHISQFYAKESSIRSVYNGVVDMVASYNQLLLALSDAERSLLRPLIQMCDKCIAQGALKLIWANENLDAYISDCNKNIGDLANFIELYQQTNAKMVSACERICDVQAIRLAGKQLPQPQQRQLLQLAAIDECVAEHLCKQVTVIENECDNIRELVVSIYDELEMHMEKIQDLWTEHVLRIDRLIQEAVTMSAQTSLQAAFDKIHGDGSFPPSALFHVLVDIQEKQIHLRPDLSDIRSFLQNIHPKLSTALAKIPRLSSALDLSVSKRPLDYCAIVSHDTDCLTWQTKIHTEIERNDQKMHIYLDQWRQYEYLWQSNKQQIIDDFGSDDRYTALDFDRKIQEYAQLSHSIDIRDTTIQVHLMIVDVSAIQNAILLELNEWKRLFLELLKSKTETNLQHFFDYIENSLKNVAAAPNSIEQLHKCSKAYERLQNAMDRCQCTMNELDEQFNVLNKYGIAFENDYDELKENIRCRWSEYVNRLADVDEMLNNAKDTFKLSLESDRKTPDFF